MSARGYFWDKKRQKWVAQFYRAGVRHYVGRYDTPEEALEARAVYMEDLIASEPVPPKLVAYHKATVEENTRALAAFFTRMGRLEPGGNVLQLIGAEHDRQQQDQEEAA